MSVTTLRSVAGDRTIHGRVEISIPDAKNERTYRLRLCEKIYCVAVKSQDLRTYIPARTERLRKRERDVFFLTKISR